MATITTRECLFCHETSSVEVPDAVADAVRERTAPIQALLPDTAPEQRELLISGIHPTCWDATFGGMAED